MRYSEEFKNQVVREATGEGSLDRLGGRLIRSCSPDGGQLGRQVQEGARRRPGPQESLRVGLRIAKLRAKNGELRQENEFLKKQPTGLRRNVRDRALRDRDREEGYYPVSSMCRCAGVSRSGYYSGRDRPESITKVRRQELRIMIKDAFEGS